MPAYNPRQLGWLIVPIRLCSYGMAAAARDPNFTAPDLWPPSSPKLNPVDYKIWSIMHQCVCESCINNVEELKQRLIEVWSRLQQNIVDTAVNKWKKRLRACVHAGATF